MIDWEKYGFKQTEDKRFAGVYFRKDFPFGLQDEDGFLTVTYSQLVPKDHVFSQGQIPATNQAVVLLLKAFNCPKLP